MSKADRERAKAGTVMRSGQLVDKKAHDEQARNAWPAPWVIIISGQRS